MILYPAIDLKDGHCVRLLRGDMQAATVFNEDPAAQAMAFVEAGASWIHVVDLNGAFSGKSENVLSLDTISSAGNIHTHLAVLRRDLLETHWAYSKPIGPTRNLLDAHGLSITGIWEESAR